MDDTDKEAAAKNINEAEQSLSLKAFLERTHPSVNKPVHDFWERISASGGSYRRKVSYSDIRLHCRQCEGERTFRALLSSADFQWNTKILNQHPVYKCGDCHQEVKTYALRISFGDNGGGQRWFGLSEQFRASA